MYVSNAQSHITFVLFRVRIETNNVCLVSPTFSIFINIYKFHGVVQTVVAACMVRSNDKRRRRTADAFVDMVVVGVVVVTTAVLLLRLPLPNMEQFSSKLSRSDDMMDIRRCCMLLFVSLKCVLVQ
jgi:Mn2+/Fe2+ NRAMP family transporter